MSLAETIVETMPDKDFEGIRQRRTSGPAKAAAQKRKQAELGKQKLQAIKLSTSSVNPIGFQVLFPTSIHNVISFFSE